MPRKRNGIPVKDEGGNRFTMVARECIETDLGSARKVVWFELETGERVQMVDGSTFLLTKSGKKLRRIRSAVKDAPPQT